MRDYFEVKGDCEYNSFFKWYVDGNLDMIFGIGSRRRFANGHIIVDLATRCIDCLWCLIQWSKLFAHNLYSKFIQKLLITHSYTRVPKGWPEINSLLDRQSRTGTKRNKSNAHARETTTWRKL